VALSYAEISVNSPSCKQLFFSYSIPNGMEVLLGNAVWVPFGNRLVQGIVVSFSHYPQVESVRPIESVIDHIQPLSLTQIKLAQWISEYYHSPLFSALALFLPPGSERKQNAYYRALEDTSTAIPNLQPALLDILNFIKQNKHTTNKQLERTFGIKSTQKYIRQLIELGLIERHFETEKERVKPSYKEFIVLNVDSVTGETEKLLSSRRAWKQLELVRYLSKSADPIDLSHVLHNSFSRNIITRLQNAGIITVIKKEFKRDSIDYSKIPPTEELTLSNHQQNALKAIHESLTEGKPRVFVLHGITGSGKTEVYLQSLAKCIALGKTGITLVPEIALTPQTIERFVGRFRQRVSVIHSRLSLGERYDQWKNICQGNCDVVIGTRSAVFAPQPRLGLIVIDEEHEWTYKQHDQVPYYQTREVAIKLAELTGATVVLGSATPSVETYCNTQSGDFTLLELPNRAGPAFSTTPEMELVNLSQELKNGNYSIFSHSLHEAITQSLARQEQVILFFNRRGSASFIQCRDCSFVIRCRQCLAPMSLHATENKLLCHQCTTRRSIPSVCPQCNSHRIKHLGIGIQKLESETMREFPNARILRWDSDSSKTANAHSIIMNKLKTHQVDILIGTQMIAKGLDLPQVTLVGVVCADIALNIPDFRAGERVFQLLTQVAGRTGRGSKPGKVIIQTYSPSHYVIQSVINRDYRAFYQRELSLRQQLYLPPFSKLIRLTFSHTNETLAKTEADRLKVLLEGYKLSAGIVDLLISGPSPAFTARLRGKFRWHLFLKGTNLAKTLKENDIPSGWVVDVDPIGLL